MDREKLEETEKGADTTPKTENAAKGCQYEAPMLHRLGNLELLQAYGKNYRDGSRYQDY